MDKKTMIALAVVAIVLIAGASFFAGTKFGGRNLKGDFASRSGMNPTTRQQMMQKDGTGKMQGQGGRLNFIDGELVSRDNKNLTMKLADGGSKIILISDSTTVSKTTAGSIDELAPGCKLMINGDTNSDGSITAKTIQLKDVPVVTQ